MLDTNHHLQTLVDDQLLIARGVDLSNDLMIILEAARESSTWANLTGIEKENLAFRVSKLAEFLVDLDTITSTTNN